MCTVLLILSSCTDVPTATHEPDPARSELELPDLGAEAPPDLELPILLPGWQELPIEALLKAEVVSFPPAGQVGVCHTQVASRTRPLPFRVHRMEVELPKAAWEEAEGRTALLQYRRFRGSKGYVIRVARCRIPASQVAVDHLFDRFSVENESLSWAEHYPPEDPRISPLGPSGLLAGANHLVLTVEDGGNCDLDNNDDEPCHLDEVIVEGEQCHSKQEYDPDLGCYCENGSDEPDCWLEPEDPGDGDGSCDPSFENCDDGGGGGGSEPLHPDAPCEGNPVQNPTIAPQTYSGVNGGRFGWTRSGGTQFHGGLDIATEMGDPLFAMYDGVLHAQTDSNWHSRDLGHYVIIRSNVGDQDVFILYAHLDGPPNLPTGPIAAGDVVGTSGDSGNLWRAKRDGYAVQHVHVEVRPAADGSWNDGVPLDPEDFLTTKFDSAGNPDPSTVC